MVSFVFAFVKSRKTAGTRRDRSWSSCIKNRNIQIKDYKPIIQIVQYDWLSIHSIQISAYGQNPGPPSASLIIAELYCGAICHPDNQGVEKDWDKTSEPHPFLHFSNR